MGSLGGLSNRRQFTDILDQIGGLGDSPIELNVNMDVIGMIQNLIDMMESDGGDEGVTPFEENSLIKCAITEDGGTTRSCQEKRTQNSQETQGKVVQDEGTSDQAKKNEKAIVDRTHDEVEKENDEKTKRK